MYFYRNQKSGSLAISEDFPRLGKIMVIGESGEEEELGRDWEMIEATVFMRSVGDLRERLEKKTKDVKMWEDGHAAGIVTTMFDAEIKAWLIGGKWTS